MPSIDVTEVLLSPDIAGDTFTVIRRTETVNGFGETTISTATLTGVGSVQATGDQSLARMEAFETQNDSIRVITPFRLRGAGKDNSGAIFQPDIVLYQGTHFIVRSINDYTAFGSGFVDAECIGIDFVDTVAA